MMAALTRARLNLPPLHLVLFLAWAILLFGGFLTGTPDPVNANRMPLWTRLGSSLVLVAAAWSWFAMARSRDSALRRLTLGLAVGMSFGALGDFMMARLIIPGDDAVLGGMASFGLGHIAYSAGLWMFATRRGLTRERIHSLIAWWIVGLLSWVFVVWRPAAEPGVMHFMALPYGILLSTTAGLATGLAINWRAFVGLALGAALFLISDFILAGEVFEVWKFAGIGDLIWLLYGPGQMLIVYAASSVLEVGERQS